MSLKGAYTLRESCRLELAVDLLQRGGGFTFGHTHISALEDGRVRVVTWNRSYTGDRDVESARDDLAHGRETLESLAGESPRLQDFLEGRETVHEIWSDTGATTTLEAWEEGEKICFGEEVDPPAFLEWWGFADTGPDAARRPSQPLAVGRDEVPRESPPPHSGQRGRA